MSGLHNGMTRMSDVPAQRCHRLSKGKAGTQQHNRERTQSHGLAPGLMNFVIRTRLRRVDSAVLRNQNQISGGSDRNKIRIQRSKEHLFYTSLRSGGTAKRGYFQHTLRDDRSSSLLMMALGTKLSEPKAKVFCQQLRLFHRCKVTTPWHLRPALDVKKTGRPFSRWRTNVFWKMSKSTRYLTSSYPILDALLDPSERTCIRKFKVRQEGSANGFCGPIDHDVR